MYIIEGNNGVGKSKMLVLIGKKMPFLRIMQEPYEQWNKQKHNQSLLKNFYDDPNRWAYTLETLTMFCRLKDHMALQGKDFENTIMERSIYSGYFCFAKNDHDSNFLSDEEWEIYSKWVDFLIKKHCKTPRGIIYMKSSPEVCFQRSKKRNRSAEESLTIDYLKNLNEKHEQMLHQKNTIPTYLKNVPILTLECNQEFEHDEKQSEKHISDIRSFIESTQTNYNAAQKTNFRNCEIF